MQKSIFVDAAGEVSVEVLILWYVKLYHSVEKWCYKISECLRGPAQCEAILVRNLVETNVSWGNLVK